MTFWSYPKPPDAGFIISVKGNFTLKDARQLYWYTSSSMPLSLSYSVFNLRANFRLLYFLLELLIRSFIDFLAFVCFLTAYFSQSNLNDLIKI